MILFCRGLLVIAIVELARKRGFKLKEMKMHREFLYLADEIFLVGTAAEVTPVSSLDHYVIGKGGRGPITRLLQENFFNVVKGKVADDFNWLTFI